MDLEGQLDVDVRDDSVAFAFTVTNEGDGTAELSFSDAQKAEFVVRDGDETVWRFGDGMMFAQMLQTASLAAGESATFEGRWESPASGEFEAVATLLATNADLEARAPVSV